MVKLIVGWIFIAFGLSIGGLGVFYGIRKMIAGETSFRLIRLLKYFNEAKGSLNDFSGTEIFVVSCFLIACSILFYLMVLNR